MSSPRFYSWALHVALPAAALALLLAEPAADLHWEHRGAHFWVVAAAAAASVWLGLATGRAARGRGDARLVLVSAAFLVAAAFLGLHALATPGVLLGAPNAGFVLATPVGLLLAAGFAAASAMPWRLAAPGVARLHRGVTVAVGVLAAGWAAVSLAGLPPLRDPLPSGAGVAVVGAVGAVLYLAAAVAYAVAYRRRPDAVLLAVITAFVLLAEAMVAVVLGRSWQLSWWEWHLLMPAAFGFVAYSARLHARREGGTAGLFDGLAVRRTVQRLRREYGAALEALVEGIREQAGPAPRGADVGRLAARVGETFALTERQTDVLVEAAAALAADRAQLGRLGALVAVGQESTVIRTEDDLLARALALAAPTFRHDALRVALVTDGTARYLDTGVPAEGAEATAALATLAPAISNGAGAVLALPLQVKGHAAGVLEVRRPHGGFAERERAVLESLASQLSIAVENTRLYRDLDGLFRHYLSPAVATALLADPAQAALGGAMCEVTVLFADLAGFTSFAERATPQEVVALLNAYYGVVTPVLVEAGGTVTQFVGDEVMALFNAPVRQPDHALRAARAGLAVQRAVAERAEPGWPRFRLGIHTGPAVVGNIGGAQMRTYTAIGDTVNTGARIQSAAGTGEVWLGDRTRELCGAAVTVRPVGPVTVKGKRDPLPVHLLVG